MILTRSEGPDDTLIYLLLLFSAGFIIECVQVIIPGRNFCWYDQAANSVGIVLGLSVTLI